MQTLTIGDRDRTGNLEIVDTRWDGNGTLRVTVRALYLPEDHTGPHPLRRMRALARRALMYPHKTRSSRVVRTERYKGSYYVTFAVSRLPR